MQLNRYTLAVIVIAICALAFTPTQSSAQTNFSEVDRILQDSLSQLAGTNPLDGGGIALVIWKLNDSGTDGVVVYEKSYALPGKTYTANKVVAIASATKGLSGLVIVGMMDAGKLSLDDAIVDIRPNVDVSKSDITIRQLFSFTSGLQGNLGGPTACVENTQFAGTLEDCVGDVLQQQLVADPGTMLNYGSDGMQVAGRLAEMKSGLPYPSGDAWDSLFLNYVKKPLALTLTGFDLPPFIDTDNPRIDGGAGSTANEYLQALIMLLQRGMYRGQRVLSAAAIDTMMADQTRDAMIGYTPYLQYETIRPGIKNTRYGVGFWRERFDTATGRALEVASQGKFGFSPWIDFERGYCAVLSVRSDLTGMYPTYLKLKEAVRSAFDAPTGVDDDVHYGANASQQTADKEKPHESWELVGFVDVLGRFVEPDSCTYCLRIEKSARRMRATPILH